MHTSMCVPMCVFVYVSVSVYMCNGCVSGVFLDRSLIFLLRQCLSMKPQLANLAILASYLVLGIPSLSPKAQGYRWAVTH